MQKTIIVYHWQQNILKFIYYEKATNFCEISTEDLSYGGDFVKFVAFSEYMNFTRSGKAKWEQLFCISCILKLDL